MGEPARQVAPGRSRPHATQHRLQEQPVVRFETAPGEEMQVDWATIRRGPDRLSVFVATLGWSRATNAEFVADERLETLLSCHEHAFLAFGGVPREVLYDNMRTVLAERNRSTGAGCTASTPASATSRGTAASGRGCAAPTGPRARMRLNSLLGVISCYSPPAHG
jgi:Integrase core domain